MLIRYLSIAALAMAAAWAQGPGRGPRGPHGPDMEGGRFGGARFLGAEAGMPGRVVKNAPYSADAITETTQTLADGNHIKQTSTSKIYRDSEGRTRREQSLRSLQSLAPNANLPEVVFINDPVTGANYALNSNDHTATKTTWNRPQGRGGPPPNRQMERRTPPNVKTESLGRQVVEGTPADGTRTTMTIPAGQVGNEQPIQIVSETWTSPDLQTVVLSKRSDPRTGEMVFRLANISRSEPPATLFQVPADYKIVESSHPPRGPRR